MRKKIQRNTINLFLFNFVLVFCMYNISKAITLRKPKESKMKEFWCERQQLLKYTKVSSVSFLDPGPIDLFDCKILLFNLQRKVFRWNTFLLYKSSDEPLVVFFIYAFSLLLVLTAHFVLFCRFSFDSSFSFCDWGLTLFLWKDVGEGM